MLTLQQNPFGLLETKNEKVGLPKTDHVKPPRKSEDSPGGFFEFRLSPSAPELSTSSKTSPAFGTAFCQIPATIRRVFMRKIIFSAILLTALTLSGCASIPPEAPELSVQLGTRISSLEAAHVRLLQEFFLEKVRRVDDFVQEAWVPIFAQEFFGDPKIDAVWKQVVQSQDPKDRIRFITLVGPRLQEKINSKRIELIQPLNELEATIKNKLKSEYDQARAINNTLTAFLQSASKVEENRKRYLDMIGITDKDVDKFVNETDQAVSELVDAARSIEDRAKDAEKYREKIKEILNKLRK